MGKVRKGRSQREEVSVISTEWVYEHTHILTCRDMEILRLLVSFPVMTISHLVTLVPQTALPSGRVVPAFHENKKAYQLCRDRVRRLYDYHFVNKYSPRLPYGEGTAPQYIWLDRAGYKLMEIDGRPPKSLSIEYRHHEKILDVYCMFKEMERRGEIIIDYLEACYKYKPKTAPIEPDIIVAFRKGKYGYKYFIEVDTGEKKEADELKKLSRYRDWELSSQWIKEDWAGLYKRRFPVVFYVCSGDDRRVSRRLTVLQKRAEEEDLHMTSVRFEALEKKIHELPT